MMKLYDYAPAPSPRRARMFLAEKGLEYENIQVDLRNREQMGEAFRAINPRRTVPVFIAPEGKVFTENAGIAAYLEAAYPEPPLLGTHAIERAEIAQWNWRCEFEGLVAVAEALRNSSPHMKDRAMTGENNVAQIPELAERGRTRLGWFFETLDAQLSQNDYVAGENYSIADITATVTVDFSAWVKASPPPSLTSLHSWHKRMSDRPSYKA